MPIDIKKYAEQWLREEETEMFINGEPMPSKVKFLLRKFVIDADKKGFEGYETLEETNDEHKLIENPKLSIIMLTYNALEYTKKAIASIKEYTRCGYELIVIDNKSTDGTQAWLKKQKGIDKLVLNKTNKGVAGGRNQGILMSEGDYILFVDNDIKVGIGWDGELLSTFENEHNVGVVGKQGNNVECYNPLRFSHFKKAPADVGIYSVDVVPGFCFCFPRNLLKNVGMQTTKLGKFWHEDLEFCGKVKKAGFRVLANTKINIVHYEHKSVTTKGRVTDEQIKQRFPGFENKAANVGKDLIDSNILYIYWDIDENPNKAYSILADALTKHLRDSGMIVIRKNKIVDKNQSFHHCKGFDMLMNGERFIYIHQENDRAPRSWKYEFEQVDKAFCVSPHTWEALLNSGIPKDKLINVGFNGIDPKVFNTKVKPYKKFPGKKVRFMTVAAAQPRKGTDLLIKYFAKAFTKDDDVSLIIKNYGYGQARWVENLLEQARKDPNCPDIIHIYEDWDINKLARAYRTVAESGAYISTHRAEAFGLPILEAICSGCMVGASDFGGTKTEFEGCIGYKFKGKLVPSTFHNWSGEPYYEEDEDPQWFEPSEKDVVDWLQKTYNSITIGLCESTRKKRYQVAEEFGQKFSFENRVAKVRDKLIKHSQKGVMREVRR